MSDFPYEDIINKAYLRKINKKPMSMKNRAAQFSPFAAVVGHDAAVEEVARLTDRKIELDEDEKLQLNEQLIYINDNIKSEPEVEIICFVADLKKDGGEYIRKKGIVKKIIEQEGVIVFKDNTKVNVNDILNIII